MTRNRLAILAAALALALASISTIGCQGLLAAGGGGEDGPALRLMPDAVPPSQESTTDVRAADLDLDGDLDLVWAGQAADPERWPDGTVTLGINDGTGVFSSEGTGVADLGPWTFVTVNDLDDDGDADLVLTKPARTRAEVAVLVNDGAAHFTAAMVPEITGEADGLVFGAVAAADVDMDGDSDLVVPIFSNVDITADRANVLLLNDGAGNFARDTESRLPVLAPDSDWTLSIAVGDVTGDGAPDLFVGEADRAPRLLVNDGVGARSMPMDVMRAYRTEMTDLDLDGDLDVTVINDVSASQPTTLIGNFFFHNDGAGHFDLVEMPLPGGRRDARGLALADMDMDGRPDIVVGNGNEFVPNDGEAVSVLLARGDGYMQVPRIPTFDFGVFGVAAGDFDGDGRPDLALAVALPGSTGDLSDVILRSIP